MQLSDALWLFLFDRCSVHSFVISTRMPMFFWVHFLTSVMSSIYFPTLDHQCVGYTHQCAFFALKYVDFSLYKYHRLTLYNMLFWHWTEYPIVLTAVFSFICPRMKQFYFFLISVVVLFSYIGEAHSLKVEKILYQGKSPYQEVLVFEVLVICWYQK
jgi:hypothetical protein